MSIPTAIEHAEVRKASKELDDLTAQLQEAREALTKAKAEMPKAIDADRDAYAAAIREGKNDPGEKRKAKAEQAITDAERRVAALRKAVVDAEGALVDAIKTNREAITGTLANRLTTADTAYLEALDALEKAGIARSEVRMGLKWLEDPQVDRRAKQGTTGSTVPSLRVRLLHKGEPAASFGEVIAGLRAVPDPPVPSRRGPGVAGSAAQFFGVKPSDG